MALPIALVGVMHAEARRDRILYGLAACLLLAAAISTYRKSAFLGPISVGLTLAYFRRRELLKLAPLARRRARSRPRYCHRARSARSSFQLDANRLGVATVSDRASDYDAVRPDLWTHLAVRPRLRHLRARSYRILDSEILNRVVEVGIVGLAAYVFMIVRRRGRPWADPLARSGRSRRSRLAARPPPSRSSCRRRCSTS